VPEHASEAISQFQSKKAKKNRRGKNQKDKDAEACLKKITNLE
jgi:hypothetical protein